MSCVSVECEWWVGGGWALTKVDVLGTGSTGSWLATGPGCDEDWLRRGLAATRTGCWVDGAQCTRCLRWEGGSTVLLSSLQRRQGGINQRREGRVGSPHCIARREE
jgi:hypothetical protein